MVLYQILKDMKFQRTFVNIFSSF